MQCTNCNANGSDLEYMFTDRQGDKYKCGVCGKHNRPKEYNQ